MFSEQPCCRMFLIVSSAGCWGARLFFDTTTCNASFSPRHRDQVRTDVGAKTSCREINRHRESLCLTGSTCILA